MKSPASVPNIISKSRLKSQVGNARSVVRVDPCVSAMQVVEETLFIFLRSSCINVSS